MKTGEMISFLEKTIVKFSSHLIIAPFKQVRQRKLISLARVCWYTAEPSVWI